MSHDTFMDAIAGRTADCAAVWVGPVLCVYPTNETALATAFVEASLGLSGIPGPRDPENAGEQRSGGSDSA